MSEPALLARVWRGAVPEVAVRGHIAVVDASGRLVAGSGDPESVTTMRSTVKPVQALPFVTTGAAAALRAGVAELAIACGSHDGGFAHLLEVRSLLARVGLDEGALSCGPQMPYGAEASAELIAAGERPRSIHNNCSGKHAAMLATCVHMGWPVDGYAGSDHPMQAAVREAFAAQGLDLTGVPCGVDGCGLPTFGVPLVALARLFATASARSEAFRACQEAMGARPLMVAGQGRFDTDLLVAAGERLTPKSGGAAVWAAAVRGGDQAVAVKLESGSGTQLPSIAIATLQALDLLPAALPDGLAAHASPPLRNWAGEVVGETRVDVRLSPG